MKEAFSTFLNKLDLINEDDITYSLTLFEHRKLKKDDFFISENKVCSQVAFIANGGVKAFSTDSNGNENITCFKFENQFITSYESFILKQTSKKSVQAIEDCELLTITYHKLNTLLNTIPAWQFISKLLLEQEFISKENYLIDFNNKSAKEKYLQVLTNSPNIVKRVKVNDLSSYLGITQRTLTRIKKEIMSPAAF